MDPMDQWMLDELGQMFPDHCIVIGPTFLGGPLSECGRVPKEWNGKTVFSGPKGYWVEDSLTEEG